MVVSIAISLLYLNSATLTPTYCATLQRCYNAATDINVTATPVNAPKRELRKKGCQYNHRCFWGILRTALLRRTATRRSVA
jgi:hypothetical protein